MNLTAILLLTFVISIADRSYSTATSNSVQHVQLIRQFWRKFNEKCQLNPLQLMELYQKPGIQGASDKLGILLRQVLRKSLVASATKIIVASIHSDAYAKDPQVRAIHERLIALDLLNPADQLHATVWDQVIEDLYVSDSELIMKFVRILQNGDGDLQHETLTIAFLSLYRLIERNGKRHAWLNPCIPVMMRYVTESRTKFNNLPQLVKDQVIALLEQLPQDLKHLYVYKGRFVLFNTYHGEQLLRLGGRHVATVRNNENESPSRGWLRSRIHATCRILIESDKFANQQAYLNVVSGDEIHFDDSVEPGWLPQWHADGEYTTFKQSDSDSLLCTGRQYGQRGHALRMMMQANGSDPSECKWRVHPVNLTQIFTKY